MIQNNSKSNSAILDQIVAALKKGHSFCFSGHQGPDADVLGSQLALAGLLRKWDASKKIDIINFGEPPKTLSYLPGISKVQSMEKVSGKYDVLVVFECSGSERMGSIIDFKSQAGTIINIDHHLHNPNYGHINFVEPTTSSTAELIYKIFKHAGVTPDKDDAVCLYTGIVADTGFFKYGNTTPQTHIIAAELIEIGIPVADISERFMMSRSEASMKLIGYLVNNMKLHYNNRVAVLSVPLDLFEKLNATSDDLEDVVNYGLMMESTVASVLLKEKKDQGIVKLSLRSKGDWDINQVARKFGGGGHKNASGCAISGSLSEVEEKVVKELGCLF